MSIRDEIIKETTAKKKRKYASAYDQIAQYLKKMIEDLEPPPPDK